MKYLLKKFKSSKRLVAMLILTALIFVEIFFVPGIKNAVLILILLPWLIADYNTERNYSLLMGFFFLVLAPVLLIADFIPQGEKSANWAFFLISIRIGILTIKNHYLPGSFYI